MNSKTIRSSF